MLRFWGGGDLVVSAVLFTSLFQARFVRLQQLGAGGIVALGVPIPLAYIREGVPSGTRAHVKGLVQGPRVPVGARFE